MTNGKTHIAHNTYSRFTEYQVYPHANANPEIGNWPSHLGNLSTPAGASLQQIQTANLYSALIGP
jgi:hypothetical protein